MGVVTVLLLVAGCSAATGEDAFIARMKATMRPPVEGSTWEGFLDIGRDICASDMSAAETIQSWNDAGMRPSEAKSIVTAAVETLCPDRKPWLDWH